MAQKESVATAPAKLDSPPEGNHELELAVVHPAGQYDQDEPERVQDVRHWGTNIIAALALLPRSPLDSVTSSFLSMRVRRASRRRSDGRAGI